MNLQYLNYKEPLKPVEDGFGFLGTLAQTEDGSLVQCHICGAVVENLGHHAWVKHGFKANEYRARFELGRTTPLCSDVWSEKYKAIKVEQWANMSEEQREERRQSMIEAQKRTVRVGQPVSLENLNKKGMCPDQLVQKIQELAEKLGHSPSFKEFGTEYNGKYVGAIIRTFGSWNGAKHIAQLEPLKSGSKVPHNRSPYTDEQLLEFLRSFKKEKGYTPTHSDWRKGFLPSYHLYKHRFGGIIKAREKAGI